MYAAIVVVLILFFFFNIDNKIHSCTDCFYSSIFFLAFSLIYLNYGKVLQFVKLFIFPLYTLGTSVDNKTKKKVYILNLQYIPFFPYIDLKITDAPLTNKTKKDTKVVRSYLCLFLFNSFTPPPPYTVLL